MNYGVWVNWQEFVRVDGYDDAADVRVNDPRAKPQRQILKNRLFIQPIYQN